VPDPGSGLFQTDAGLQALHHRLSNQLGIILAHAEMLEDKVVDEVTRARAARIVAGALEAIGTARLIRQWVDAAAS
jgi:two-component sensor histidine kinase